VNRLYALSAGARAPTRRFTGIVHSVFARACNLALDDGRLLALLAPELGNAPGAVRIAVARDFAFDRAIRAGAPAGCRAGVLRIAGEPLEIRLDSAAAWRVGLDALAADPLDNRVRAARRVVRERLARRLRSAPAPRPRLPIGRIRALAGATRALDPVRAIPAVEGLVGCGPGLTPAGDDLLVGLLAGLRACARSSPARARFLEAVAPAVRAAAARTNRISAAYLDDAADGEIAEPLADLAAAIARGAHGRALERTAARALAAGATSGADGVRGLLIGTMPARATAGAAP